LLSVKLS